MTQTGPARLFSVPVIIALVLLVGIAAFFLFEVFTFSEAATEEALTPAELEERAAALAASGDAERGALHVETYQCVACHVIGTENNIAPPFAGVATRAAERRPPLSAEAYLYESIVNPGAYIVEGFQNSMVQNFEERVTDQELGDILAYLLTQTGS